MKLWIEAIAMLEGGIAKQLRGEEIVKTIPKEVLEQFANDEIGRFNKFFQDLGNETLVKPEVAMLKTYIAWKLGLGAGAKKNA